MVAPISSKSGVLWSRDTLPLLPTGPLLGMGLIWGSSFEFCLLHLSPEIDMGTWVYTRYLRLAATSLPETPRTWGKVEFYVFLD